MKAINQTKFSATMESRNFFVSVVTLIFSIFAFNEVIINVDPTRVVDTIADGGTLAILSMIIVNFLNPIMKLIRNAENWSWEFLRSPNFWVQGLTVFLLSFSFLGFNFDTGTAQLVVDAITSGDLPTIIATVVINVLNPLYHFFFDRPKINPDPDKEDDNTAQS